MSKQYDMPGWPPTEEEWAQISRRIRAERAAVARSIFFAVFGWIMRKPDQQPAVRPHAFKVPFYY